MTAGRLEKKLPWGGQRDTGQGRKGTSQATFKLNDLKLTIPDESQR